MQSSFPRHRVVAAVFALLALAACKRDPAGTAGVISRERFVAANVAVRTVPDSAPQARRDAALKKAGVTEKQLRAWVTVYSRQPETLAKTWEEIAFKVDSIGGAQPVAQTPGGITAPPAVAGMPVPPRRRDSLGNVLPGPDSLLARRRRPPPPRPVRRDKAADLVPVQ